MSKQFKTAPKHSPEQIAEFIRQFEIKARRYRLRFKIALTVALVGVVGPVLFIKFPTVWPWAFLIGWVLSLMCLLFLGITMDFLPACPACHGDIGRRFGKFCRECGVALVPDPEQQIHLVCPSGGHAYFNSDGKYRRGRIRHCPCCGLFLDEKGLN